MKIKRKIDFTLGDLIAAAYRVWGASQAEKMVQMAIHSRLIVFQGQPLYLISSAKAGSV